MTIILSQIADVPSNSNGNPKRPIRILTVSVSALMFTLHYLQVFDRERDAVGRNEGNMASHWSSNINSMNAYLSIYQSAKGGLHDQTRFHKLLTKLETKEIMEH